MYSFGFLAGGVVDIELYNSVGCSPLPVCAVAHCWLLFAAESQFSAGFFHLSRARSLSSGWLCPMRTCLTGCCAAQLRVHGAGAQHYAGLRHCAHFRRLAQSHAHLCSLRWATREHLLFLQLGSLVCLGTYYFDLANCNTESGWFLFASTFCCFTVVFSPVSNLTFHANARNPGGEQLSSALIPMPGVWEAVGTLWSLTVTAALVDAACRVRHGVGTRLLLLAVGGAKLLSCVLAWAATRHSTRAMVAVFSQTCCVQPAWWVWRTARWTRRRRSARRCSRQWRLAWRRRWPTGGPCCDGARVNCRRWRWWCCCRLRQTARPTGCRAAWRASLSSLRHYRWPLPCSCGPFAGRANTSAAGVVSPVACAARTRIWCDSSRGCRAQCGGVCKRARRRGRATENVGVGQELCRKPTVMCRRPPPQATRQKTTINKSRVVDWICIHARCLLQ